MTQSKSTFSTLRGILLIVGFFCVLLLVPVISQYPKAKFDSEKTDSGSPSSFPMSSKVGVFRSSSSPNTKAKNKLSLEELIQEDSSPILINFWATWCPPCLEELPSLESLHRQLSSNGNGKNRLARLITISVDDRVEDIRKLESTLDFKPSYPVFHDKEGELARTMGTTKFPETYLVNREGKILYKWLGPQDWLSKDVLHQLKLHSK